MGHKTFLFGVSIFYLGGVTAHGAVPATITCDDAYRGKLTITVENPSAEKSEIEFTRTEVTGAVITIKGTAECEFDKYEKSILRCTGNQRADFLVVRPDGKKVEQVLKFFEVTTSQESTVKGKFLNFNSKGYTIKNEWLRHNGALPFGKCAIK